jgi:predicted DNA repair protein MutK
MPGASLLALLDDIASVLDDVALLTKVATKKTAGVLGDDLALNAQQVAGIRAERELPVVWAVAKGSLVNKAILVPSALAISAVAPWLVTPLLMVGGGFLCFEGCEKLAHKLLHGKEEDEQRKLERAAAVANPEVDLVALEKEKVKGAIRTDFVLSAEIVAIALGTVATSPFMIRVWVLAGLAVLMTAGVYGLVGAIVKLDDLGALLTRRADATEGGAAALQRGLGYAIVRSAPWLMKGLSVAGTIAMFLVGGGILAHGIPGVPTLEHHASESVAALPGIGPLLSALVAPLINLVIGIVGGSLILGAVTLVKKLRSGDKATSH